MPAPYSPFQVAKKLADEYRHLLRTVFRPARQELRDAFDAALNEEGFLVRDIYLQVLPAYERTEPIEGLSQEVRQWFGQIAERPYRHQAEAASRILQGQPVILATGTGSGKTEAFLMPIVDWCFRHRGKTGVKAILIYPMNALVNNQRDRLRRLLAGTGISFGRYTGETELSGERPSDAPDEERCVRSEFWQNPPDLLLTNYQMLDYMLIRDDGRRIFKNHQVRFIVLDEVHNYHGKLGTDIAFLMRRLRAFLKKMNPNAPEPIFIGTSATLQSGMGEDPRQAIAEFFTKLTGQKTEKDAVILDTPVVPPPMPPDLTMPALPEISEQELDAFDPKSEESVKRLAAKLVSDVVADGADAGSLYARTPLAYRLLEWLQKPIAFGELVNRWAKERGIEPNEQVQREVEAALLVGSALPDEHPLKLRLRTHRLLRGLLPFWRCLNCGKLLRHGERDCPNCGSKALPLVLCRTCGWDFYACYKPDEDKKRLHPWVQPTSTDQTIFLYEPPKESLEVDAEEETTDEGSEETTTQQHYSTLRLCPKCLAIVKDGVCPSGCSAPLREFAAYERRGTICPICRSRYGNRDVLTKVNMGVSRAVKEVARALIQYLPEEQQKVLIFCDSRQDAAHQAWFIKNTEKRLSVRRAIYHCLKDEEEPHDWEWLKGKVLEWLVRNGIVTEELRTRDARERALKRVEGALLTEFAIQPNVRQSLERLGLVRVRYAGLEEVLRRDNFEQLCREHNLPTEKVRQAIPHLLDLMRTKGALAHPAIQRAFNAGSQVAVEYDLLSSGGRWFPKAFTRPGQSMPSREQQNQGHYQLLRAEMLLALCQRFLGSRPTLQSLQALLEFLEQTGHLIWANIGNNGQGYQVALDLLEFEVARSWVRCDTCGRVVANEPAGTPCPRVSYQKACQGKLREWDGPFAESNVWALQIAHPNLPPINAGEHTAAVTDEERQRIEQAFQKQPPEVNAIACTPTLELGIDIGDLEAVALRNIPPNPAHYAQRAGRTGRQTRMGVVAGFSRARPHDGYFFDHPDEIIFGAIYPPRFYADNRIALACHVRSIVFEEAQLPIPPNLEPYISDEGHINATEVEKLVNGIQKALETGKRRALEVFGDFEWVNEQWVDEVIRDFPEKVRQVIELRAKAIEEAVKNMRFYANKVQQTQQERQLEQGYRELANRLRTDRDYAYLPRVLAEAGLLPGYAFPPQPGSLHLGLQPEPIFTSRLQAQWEYAPGQVVYARGGKWEVKGIALNQPGGITERGILKFEFTLCPSCGLANPKSNNNCLRCGAELTERSKIAWDVGAFRAELTTAQPEEEEDRSMRAFDFAAHPQRDGEVVTYHLGDGCYLEMRRQESIFWLNLGRIETNPDGTVKEVRSFWICEKCGESVEPPAEGSQKAKKGRKQKAQRRHSQTCDGEPIEIALGHQTKADTLRLIVPGVELLGAEGVRWAWSLVYAIVQGAALAFQLDEEDIDGFVLVKRDEQGEQVLEIFWVDTVVGGSGVLQDLAENFPKVAKFALKHLEGHDCAGSCYRCLRTYRNQKVHHLLDWQLIVDWLKVAAQAEVVQVGRQVPPMQGPEWEEARREGCQSPAELRLLKAIRSAGLPEPEKQYQVVDEQGQLITAADFAYPEHRLLIYVDGLAFHSSLPQRLHDARINRWLQRQNYRVLRFLGTEVYRYAKHCVEEIQKFFRSD
ncbi:DEAD-box ATP-dependent RNA helicase CshA [bacterium HR17]|uniref:DEAD-box ATP-dependent RNA helicase CshA n=1 Tax=Candidatus Fervidibacter japonicus TaxID=2035412 RepID=A0A2H5XC44_9BACT|nr:DEAD-box ATP-dependent RNA helicase CshA [bacterium HR17]